MRVTRRHVILCVVLLVTTCCLWGRHRSPAPVDVTTLTPGHKYILIWAGCWGTSDCGWPLGTDRFQECGGVAETRCVLTDDRRLLPHAAIVIFHVRDMNNVLHPDLPSYRHPDQIWVFFTHESPYKTFTGVNLRPLLNTVGRTEYLDGLFNATMTHVRSSEFFLPYAGIKPRDPPGSDFRPALSSKTKLVLWVVSNCRAESFRYAYAQELRKYIPVDVYGGCGEPSPCSRTNHSCFAALARQYKFYLSFENSQCKDYITEKFWRIFDLGTVPVALGGWMEDYTALAPPDSFLHVDNFTGPEHLAEHIRYLDQNDTAYLTYFSWRRRYEVTPGYRGLLDYPGPFCEMCRVAHDLGSFGRKTYNVSVWYSSRNMCRDPGDLNT